MVREMVSGKACKRKKALRAYEGLKKLPANPPEKGSRLTLLKTLTGEST